MTRRTRFLLALTIVLVVGLARTAGLPAVAAPAQQATGYRYVTWLTELGSFSVDAPRGWRVTRPAEDTGRVTSPDGSQRLSLTELGGATTVRAALAARAAAIAGLADAVVLHTGRRVLSPTTGGYTGGTLSIGSLAYRWRDPAGRPRLVLTRVIGLDTRQGSPPRAFYELTASGPTGDAAVLRTMIREVTPTVFSTP